MAYHLQPLLLNPRGATTLATQSHHIHYIQHHPTVLWTDIFYSGGLIACVVISSFDLYGNYLGSVNYAAKSISDTACSP
jgi:hypothetical protein